MIHLTGEYYIKTDELNYIVGKRKIRKRKDKQTGETIEEYYIDNPRYYQDICEAVFQACEAANRDNLTNFTGELIDAVTLVRRGLQEYSDLVDKVKKMLEGEKK